MLMICFGHFSLFPEIQVEILHNRNQLRKWNPVKNAQKKKIENFSSMNLRIYIETSTVEVKKDTLACFLLENPSNSNNF